jgi:TolA-binding protein
MAQLAAGQKVRQTLAEQPWDEALDRQAVDKAMLTLFPPRPARLWHRRGVQIAFALSLLLSVVGVAGAALWRLHRSAFLLLPAPQPAARAVAATAPASPAESGFVAEPGPPADEPIQQRAPRAQPSAATLFAQAVALRSEGKVDAAIATHQRLQRLYPTARETRVSFALAGRLLLEKGSPDQALAQFEQYLSRPGDIAEEALVGRATALGHLGHSTAEAAAWREVLARHPGSVWATQAKNRLSALAEKPRAATDPTPHH